MAYEPHAHHDEHVHEPERSGGLTSYAAVKYGFILLITIVILYFIARFILPLFT